MCLAILNAKNKNSKPIFVPILDIGLKRTKILYSWHPFEENILVTAYDKTIKIINCENQEFVTFNMLGKICSMDMHPNGKIIVCGFGAGEIKLFCSETGEYIKTLKDHKHGVCAIKWSPDGKKLLSGDESGEVIMWDFSAYDFNKK